MEADIIIINENGILGGQMATDNIAVPKEVDGRWVRVAHMYVHARKQVNMALDIAGLSHLRVSFI